jgi:hypothetical protein
MAERHARRTLPQERGDSLRWLDGLLRKGEQIELPQRCRRFCLARRQVRQEFSKFSWRSGQNCKPWDSAGACDGGVARRATCVQITALSSIQTS